MLNEKDKSCRPFGAFVLLCTFFRGLTSPVMRSYGPLGLAGSRRISASMVVLFYVVLFGVSGCGKKKPVMFKSPSIDVMSTIANLIAVADDEATAEAAVAAAVEKLHYVNKLMSDYDPEAQLYKVNQTAFAGPVKVDDDLMYVLKESVKYSEVSGGAFDVTVGPMVDLWHKAGEEHKRPSDEEIAAAKAKVGYEKLILNDDGTVRFKVDGMRVDLGGIAKGYSIDLAIEAMKQAGAVAGMVDVGGDIRCFGKPVEKDSWRIGLQDPRSSEILLVLKFNDVAIATSGDYQRFVEVDGERYSHIMNPKAGSSAKELESVTVIAPTAIAADALATSVSVMGAKDGLKMVEGIDGVETIAIPNKEGLSFVHTRGVVKYIDMDFVPDSYTAASAVSGP